MFATLCVLVFGGARVGFLSGLLGVGGAMIIVPLLNLLFSGMGLPQNLVQHLAVGTAPSTILFTALVTFLAHARMGARRWDVWRKTTPGIILGAAGGAVLAHHIDGRSLEILFAAIIIVMSGQMIMGFKPRPRTGLQAFFFPVGMLVGGLASLSGVAGTLQLVVFLAWAGFAWCDCVGTAAALSLPIALASTLSYMAVGWNVPELPRFSLGYVYLPGTFGLMIPSMLMAVAGAKLAHWPRLPVAALKRGFGGFGVFVGLSILFKALAA